MLCAISQIVSENSIAHKGEIDIACAKRMLICTYYKISQVKAKYASLEIFVIT